MYTAFAATLLGLGAISIISVLDGWEWWKVRKEKTAVTVATTQVLPTNTGCIQTGMITHCYTRSIDHWILNQ